MTDRFTIPIECRADESREGPAESSGRFLKPGAWRPTVKKFSYRARRSSRQRASSCDAGIAAKPVLTFDPIVDGSAIRIDARLPDTQMGRQVAAEVRSGERSALSVEFVALDEARVQGVRELRQALIKGAALVPSGSYAQASAEIRQRAGRRYRRVWQ